MIITKDDKVIIIITETYIETRRTSTMELFCKNSKCLQFVNYFRKRAPT